MSNLAMIHDKDPKQELFDKLGDLSDVEVFNNQIILATYVRPEKTKGGIIVTDNFRSEDLYQGKIGLLVAKGHSAFQEETGEWFGDSTFDLGDWLVFRPSDGWNITIHGVPCRILSDTQVKGRVKSPDSIF